MLRCTVALTAICLLSISAAAESSAGLAAPGDCAQPSAGFETPPPFQQAANVGGGAADHFAPRVEADVLGRLPLDATRTGATRLVDGVVSSTAEGVSGTVDGAAGAVGSTVDGLGDTLTGAVGGAGDAIGAPGLGGLTGSATDALGSGGLTGGVLGTTTGTVDALTGTATGTVNSLLGGRK